MAVLRGDRLAPAGAADDEATGEFVKSEAPLLRFVRGEFRQVVHVVLPSFARIGQAVPADNLAPVQAPGPLVSKVPAQAAPAKPCQMLYRHDARSHGIEVDVIGHPAQCRCILDQQRLIPALEQVPPLRPEPIEPCGVGALQPMHPGNQVASRRLHCQMEVIAHHDMRVQPPLVRLAGLHQRLLKGPRRPRALEDVPPIVPTVDHVVDCPRKLDTQLSRHGFALHGADSSGEIHTKVAPIGLTPSARRRAQRRAGSLSGGRDSRNGSAADGPRDATAGSFPAAFRAAFLPRTPPPGPTALHRTERASAEEEADGVTAAAAGAACAAWIIEDVANADG